MPGLLPAARRRTARCCLGKFDLDTEWNRAAPAGVPADHGAEIRRGGPCRGPQMLRPSTNGSILNAKGRIKKLLEQDDPSIVTYLINAMTFDAEWASPSEPQSRSEGTFHASDGAEQTVTYLSGEERGYLEVAGATGFVKHYSGGRYSFAGLLPGRGRCPRRLCWRRLTARRCCRQSVIRNRKRSTRVCRNLPLRPRQSSSRCWSVWACRRPLRTLRISRCCLTRL